MSEDRLARIEAALDNQVAVNAELRTSTQQLRATAEALLSTVQIHQQNFEVIAARINTLAESQIQTNARLEEYQRTAIARLEEYQRTANARLEEYQRTANAQLEDYKRTTNAALERIDAMLDYLIRQQNS